MLTQKRQEAYRGIVGILNGSASKERQLKYCNLTAANVRTAQQQCLISVAAGAALTNMRPGTLQQRVRRDVQLMRLSLLLFILDRQLALQSSRNPSEAKLPTTPRITYCKNHSELPCSSSSSTSLTPERCEGTNWPTVTGVSWVLAVALV